MKNVKEISKYAYLFISIILAVLVFYLGSQILSGSYDFIFIREFSKILGIIALILLVLTLIPGITTRFGLKSKIFTVLRIARPEVGKLMFLFALAHYLLIKTLPLIGSGTFDPSNPPVFLTFELFGLAALTLTIPLFLTSSNFMIRKLGKWWGRIHSLIYVIIWLVFIHIALVEIGPITVVAGITAILEIASLIVFYVKKANKKVVLRAS